MPVRYYDRTANSQSDGVEGDRIAFDVFETRFQGAGATLADRLVLPKGKAPAPIVVLVYGSDRGSALARVLYAAPRRSVLGLVSRESGQSIYQ